MLSSSYGLRFGQEVSFKNIPLPFNSFQDVYFNYVIFVPLACQFMGPAMQEEALKLVLLALEDGSALSRKVLVMFVVQRLAPQFPQV